MVLIRGVNKNGQAVDMLIIIPMGEMYNAMPVKVRIKTTCKITLPGREGIGESLTNWRREQGSGED